MNDFSVNYQKLDWKDANSYPVGSKIKILREDDSGAKTILLKLPPNFYMEKHSHMTTEQHFILEGEYESGDELYRPGTYQLIPKHITHGPFKSKNGAVILVIWDKE